MENEADAVPKEVMAEFSGKVVSVRDTDNDGDGGGKGKGSEEVTKGVAAALTAAGDVESVAQEAADEDDEFRVGNSIEAEDGDEGKVLETALERSGNSTKVVLAIACIKEINPDEPLSSEMAYVPDRASGRAGQEKIRSLDELVLNILRVSKRRLCKAGVSISSRKRIRTRMG